MELLGLVLLAKELKWRLAEVVDLADDALDCFVVLADGPEDLGVRVAVRVKDVVLLLRVLVLPEDQVDPTMQVLTNIVTLQCRPQRYHELLCARSPVGQLHIPDVLSALLLPQLDVGEVLQENGHVVKLRYRLLYVRSIGLVEEAIPHLLHRAEKPIRQVEPSFLHIAI